MANYYYVKSGGTATGDGGRVATTPRTGTWNATASEYYDNITDAIAATTAPADGDFILVSDAHTHTYAANTTYSIAADITVMSVSNSNQDQYSAGASEQATGGTYDIYFGATTQGNQLQWYGIDVTAQDELLINSAASRKEFRDCTLKTTGASGADLIRFNGVDGAVANFTNCTFTFGAGSQGFGIVGGSQWVFNECTFTGTNHLVDSNAPSGNGGGSFIANNCDFSGMSTALDPIFETGDSAGDDRIYIELNRCLILPSTTNWLPTLGSPNVELVINSCEDATKDDYFYQYYENYMGSVETNTVTYLNATYDGSTGFSIQFSTTANARPVRPLRRKIATLSNQDLTTAKTVTVECTSDASLTDNDIWIEVEVNDNTDEALGVVSSTQNSDPLAAGTALTTAGTGTWTSGDTEDYIITHNIGAQTNVDNGNVTVYACVGKASIDANFDLPTIAAT